MISPLQVTILFVIADSAGDIPSAKWSLFQRYYEVLKQRESAKGGVLARALKSNQQHVDRLHRWAGLSLHIASESIGGADAVLSPQLFESLLRACLTAGGVPGDEIEEKVELLVEVALNRLVLLAARQENRISFDVRSLQEFMAVDAITTGGDSFFEGRVKGLIKSAHWRHTFLIAASRCYADGTHEHLRTTFFGVARELHSAEESDEILQSGALLALDMFVDGVGLGSSIHRVILPRHALSLLSLGDVVLDLRLKELYEKPTRSLLLETLAESMRRLLCPTFRAAWKLAFELANDGHEDVCELVISSWPDDDQRGYGVLQSLVLPIKSQRVAQAARSECLRQLPSKIVALIHELSTKHETALSPSENHSAQVLSLSLHGSQSRRRINLLPLEHKDYALSIHYHSIHDKSSAASLLSLGGGWIWLQVIARFWMDPCCETLGTALAAIAETAKRLETLALASSLPWPLAWIISLAASDDDLRALAKQASKGDLGNLEDWSSAEKRWVEHGALEQDIMAEPNAQTLKSVAQIGVPPMRSYAASLTPATFDVAARLAKMLNHFAISTELKAELARVAMFGFSVSFKKGIIGLSDIVSILELCPGSPLPLPVLKQLDREQFYDKDLLIRLSRLRNPVEDDDVFERNDGISLANTLVENIECRGLCKILAICVNGLNLHEQLSILSDLPSTILQDREDDCPSLRLSAFSLRLRKDEQVIIPTELFSEEQFGIGCQSIIGAIEDNPHQASSTAILVNLIKEAQCCQHSIFFSAFNLLKSQMETRASYLTERERWLSLALPESVLRIAHEVRSSKLHLPTS